MSAMDRLTPCATISDFVKAVESMAREIFPDGDVVVADDPQTITDEPLRTRAVRAFAYGQSVTDGDATIVVGSDGRRPVIVVATTPPCSDPRLELVANVAGRLMSLQNRVMEATDPIPLSVTDEVRALDDRARADGNCVVIGLVDTGLDPTLTAAGAELQRDLLGHRLRKILRQQDRVWAWEDRLLVAQVLPEPKSALLTDRLLKAVRAVHSEQGVARRIVDSWVTARCRQDRERTEPAEQMQRIERAERGLQRLADLRQIGVRVLQHGQGMEAFGIISDPNTAVVVVDTARLIRAVNQVTLSFFPEAASDGSTNFPPPQDALDTDQLTFHHVDGSVLVDDELPGVFAMKTGWSGQDQLIGVRFRNFGIHWVLVSAVTVSDPEGRALGYVASMTRTEVDDPAIHVRLRDALDLIEDPVILLTPYRDSREEIVDFVVTHANGAAISALSTTEQDLIGARESVLNPSRKRLGIVLDYAGVVTSGHSSRQVVTIPDGGGFKGTFEVTAEPCAGGVLVVARSKANAGRTESVRMRDALTGLASRQGLVAMLDEVQRKPHGAVTLVMCDIDDFTGVNDSLGRLRSDRYLVEVAKALSQLSDVHDVVARIGSDEFAIMSLIPDSPTAAMDLAERVRRRLQAGVSVGERKLTAAASVGVVWAPAWTSTSDLIASADVAMSRSKIAGGDCVTVSRGRVIGSGSVDMESHLRSALDNDEFEVHYQPIVNLADRRIIGVEALLRWRHPKRGVISPAEFIPVAERRHLMVDLGLLVVDKVCAQSAVWLKELGRPVRISINVSTAQLIRPGLATAIRRSAADSGIDPTMLELEITESQLLNADEATLVNLNACRDIGCALAIDDFGTGHAGFDYLRRIPAETLKIDKTFIDGLDRDSTDTAIAAGVTAVGHGMGLTVVAEGVERPEQAEVLARLGCDAGQGWLWARAMPADEVLTLLDAGYVTP